jgi:hypothetical protein
MPFDMNSQDPSQANILTALLQRMQQGQGSQDQSAQPPAPDQTPPPQTQQPAAPQSRLLLKPAEDDGLESMSSTLLRGMFAQQQNPQQQIPAFKDDTSPARSILANMMYGMSASLTGTKFQSVRDRKYAEYLQGVKQQQEQQQIQAQRQQAMAQLASTVMQHRQNLQFQQQVEGIKVMQHDADKAQAKQEFQTKTGMDYEKFLQENDKFQEEARHNRATEGQAATNESTPNDANYKQALNEISSQYGAKGLKPTDAQNYPKFLQEVAQRKTYLDTIQAGLQKQGDDKPLKTLMYVPQEDGSMKAIQVNPGDSVPKGAITAPGVNSLGVPTAATRTMAEKAPRVNFFVDRINQLLDDNEKTVGPLAGRMAQFKSGKLGLPNKGWAQINADLGLLQTALMNMHVGARGGEGMMDHFKGVIGDIKQDPANIRDALGEIKMYASEVAKEGNPKGAPAPSALPTKRFNPATGALEDVK